MSQERTLRRPRLVAIVGPTAAGKSALALRLARRFQGEIVSADSMQVYRGLDIGTGKPTAEERRLVPHHLIDIVDPDQPYHAARFRAQAEEMIADLDRRGVPILIVGGTGLYLKALIRGLFHGPGEDPELRRFLLERAAGQGVEALHEELKKLDPEAALRIHPQDASRLVRALEVFYRTRRPISAWQKEHGFREILYRVLKIGLLVERQALRERIEKRVEEMLRRGWVEEVRLLLENGYSPDLKALQALGYRQIVSFLRGEVNLEEAVGRIKRDTYRYAKRQITWFKADPEIIWFSGGGKEEEIERKVAGFLAQS